MKFKGMVRESFKFTIQQPKSFFIKTFNYQGVYIYEFNVKKRKNSISFDYTTNSINVKFQYLYTVICI
jgi:hypothetical protein